VTTDRIRCDAFGCIESHPAIHDEMDEQGFEPGYWLGWLYLDLNRPDLSWRPLRFCGTSCLMHWVQMHRERPQVTALDLLLRDEIAMQRHRMRTRTAMPTPEVSR
jgi:hypothetical protein